MSIAEMRKEMVDMISKLDESEVEETYGALLNHFSDKIDDDWNEPIPLAELRKGIEEADRGEVFPLEQVLREVRAQYGLNG